MILTSICSISMIPIISIAFISSIITTTTTTAGPSEQARPSSVTLLSARMSSKTSLVPLRSGTVGVPLQSIGYFYYYCY